jgi:hypothetical protein
MHMHARADTHTHIHHQREGRATQSWKERGVRVVKDGGREGGGVRKRDMERGRDRDMARGK